ncbi:MAG: DUF3795 domain-containing protein [Chloroflexota bacterium]|nr:DUF3795 domain-containing protein [Chloroflexota bacterium]
MDKIIAYCGLVCSDCEAYIATQANDLAALEQMATRAREEFGMPDATAESARCDGCLDETTYKCGYCAVCEIRVCGIERGVINCAYCTDYACEKLDGFHARATGARATLDEIRALL